MQLRYFYLIFKEKVFRKIRLPCFAFYKRERSLVVIAVLVLLHLSSETFIYKRSDMIFSEFLSLSKVMPWRKVKHYTL